MVTTADVFLNNPDGSAADTSLIAIRSAVAGLAFAFPEASIAVSLVDGSSLLCVASSGDVISEGTYLSAAAIPGLAAAQSGCGLFPFQCTLPATVGRFEHAFAIPSFTQGRMLGCILVFCPLAPDASLRDALTRAAATLAPCFQALVPALPSQDPSTHGQGPRSVHFLHDCRSEVSVIFSAVECLERYGDSWDDATWLRYLAKIKASAAKLSVLLESR